MSVLKNIGQACLNPVALIGFGFLSWIWRHDYVMQGDPVGELLAFPFGMPQSLPQRTAGESLSGRQKNGNG